MPLTNRRGFLGGLLAVSIAPTLSWADAGSPAFLAAAKDTDGSFAMFGLDLNGKDLFRVPLPIRGHAACAHPIVPEAVAFARRPGTVALVIDCINGKILAQLDAPMNRHFNGHGIFLDDGDILCTPENDFEQGQGVIGLWSRSSGYLRIGEVPTGGIGPHDLKRLPDSNILVVANGGILTHPGSGREKLNLETMHPNLCYIDPFDGIQELVELDTELHLNSIRHIDIRFDGTVALALQWQGDISEPVPLLGKHQRGNKIQLIEAPLGPQLNLKGYAGSVSYNGPGDILAITSPRGGQVHYFDDHGVFLGNWSRPDVSGLQALGQGFLVSDGNGALHKVLPDEAELLTVSQRSWDNHIISI